MSFHPLIEGYVAAEKISGKTITRSRSFGKGRAHKLHYSIPIESIPLKFDFLRVFDDGYDLYFYKGEDEDKIKEIFSQEKIQIEISDTQYTKVVSIIGKPEDFIGSLLEIENKLNLL